MSTRNPFDVPRKSHETKPWYLKLLLGHVFISAAVQTFRISIFDRRASKRLYTAAKAMDLVRNNNSFPDQYHFD